MTEVNVKGDQWLFPFAVKGLTKNDGSLASCELIGPQEMFKIKIKPELVPFLEPNDMVFVSITIFKPSVAVETKGPPVQLIKGK